jgi:DNA-binding response OmpR family regulator
MRWISLARRPAAPVHSRTAAEVASNVDAAAARAAVEEASPDVHIGRLRAKLAHAAGSRFRIASVRGSGYRLDSATRQPYGHVLAGSRPEPRSV